jgi:putative phosphoesterase
MKQEIEKINRKVSNKVIKTIGVIADTHIPDRTSSLHPSIIPIFVENKVDIILHAGDICNQQVLDRLGKIAEVKAVRGNRDWFFEPALPMQMELEIMGIKILLAHGHASFWHYLEDKIDHTLRGYRFARYEKLFLKEHSQNLVFIFGHSHAPENRWVKDRLFFNPGSASMGWNKKVEPSIGLIDFLSDGEVNGRIIPLSGWEVRNHEWQECA